MKSTDKESGRSNAQSNSEDRHFDNKEILAEKARMRTDDG